LEAFVSKLSRKYKGETDAPSAVMIVVVVVVIIVMALGKLCLAANAVGRRRRRRRRPLVQTGGRLCQTEPMRQWMPPEQYPVLARSPGRNDDAGARSPR